MLLLDEPCSALDPISTATIEELIVGLRETVAIVIVTHNLQQAFRVADHVAFMHLGELVEYGTSEQVFDRPPSSARATTSAEPSGEARALLALLAALALAGCETTAEKSAKLEQAANAARRRREPAAATALASPSPSSKVRVQQTTLVHGKEGTAAVVTRAQHLSDGAARHPDRDQRSRTQPARTVYTNTTPGLARTLVSIPSLARARGARAGSTTRCRRAGAAVAQRDGRRRRSPRRAPAPQIVVSGTSAVRRPGERAPAPKAR